MADRIPGSLGNAEADTAPDVFQPRNVKCLKNCYRWRGNSHLNSNFDSMGDRKKLSMFLLLRMAPRANFLLMFIALAILLGGHHQGVAAQFYDDLKPQKFAMEPQDQTAIVGSRVTLPCRVINKAGSLQWTKDDFGLGPHRNLSGFERYSMVGSDEEGDFSLDIYPVLLEDDARYQCQVGLGVQGQTMIRSRFAKLSVLVPPDPPKIVQGPRLIATEDQEVELECVSVGGKPAAEITWIDGEGNVMTNNLRYTIDLLQDGRRVTAKSLLRLTPKRRHHNQTLTCQAQNTADRAYRSATVHLEVRHAPVVTLRVPSDVRTGGRVKEGSDLNLTNRPDIVLVDHSKNTTYIVDVTIPHDENLQKAERDKILKYMDLAHEIKDMWRTPATIVVPIVISTNGLIPKSLHANLCKVGVDGGLKYLMQKAVLLSTCRTLLCKVDANPSNVTYRWFLNDDQISTNTLTHLTLYNVTRDLNNAIIRCEAHNDVGRSEDSETLDVAYGPSFRTRPNDVETDMDSTVTLTCDVEGNPPAKIIWLHEDQDRWSVVGRTANLTITADSSSSGKYLCKASVPGFQEIEAHATVYLRGPPAVVSRRAQASTAGGPAKVQCLAVAVPRPRVLWLLQGKPITEQDQDFSILEDVLPDGVRSTLVIRESQSRHFGAYNCSASNDYGTDVVEITLVAQRPFPLLVTISGILGGTVILVAIAMIFVLCRKRKLSEEKPNHEGGGNKKPDVMVDTERAGVDKRSQNSDRSSCTSDLKLDLKDAENTEMQEYRVGIPMSGTMVLPETQNGMLHQYPRFSNEYIDPLFPPGTEYKDDHGYTGYTSYVDYTRDYSPSLMMQPPLTAMGTHDATRVQLTSLHSSHQLTAHLNQLNVQLSSLADSGAGSVNSSLARSSADTNSTAPCGSGSNSQNSSLQRAAAVRSPETAIFRNGSIVTYTGNDIRHASLSNPHTRIALGTINTANPAATPAPPPYTGHRVSSLVNGSISTPPGSLTPTSSFQSTATGSVVGVGLPSQTMPNGCIPGVQNCVQSPQAAQYILPPSSQVNGQIVHITKKGTGTQPALATHV